MSLSREAEGTGPVMPGNLIFIKVPIPADYPKDEVLCRLPFGERLFFLLLGHKKRRN